MPCCPSAEAETLGLQYMDTDNAKDEVVFGPFYRMYQWVTLFGCFPDMRECRKSDQKGSLTDVEWLINCGHASQTSLLSLKSNTNELLFLLNWASIQNQRSLTNGKLSCKVLKHRHNQTWAIMGPEYKHFTATSTVCVSLAHASSE